MSRILQTIIIIIICITACLAFYYFGAYSPKEKQVVMVETAKEGKLAIAETAKQDEVEQTETENVKSKEQIEFEIREAQQNATKELDECMAKLNETHDAEYERECKPIEEGPDSPCSVPHDVAVLLAKSYKEKLTIRKRAENEEKNA